MTQLAQLRKEILCRLGIAYEITKIIICYTDEQCYKVFYYNICFLYL